MALMVDLRVTVGDGTQRIEVLEVRRLTRLHSRSHPGDETHRYAAVMHGSGGARATAEFEHRYGDGAWVCVLKALEALEALRGE